MIAKLILIATAGAVCLYIFLRGVLDFYTEAYGTLLLSPTIYIRLAPAPLDEWLLRACVSFKGFDLLICAAPVVLFGVALLLAQRAFQRQSVPLAVLASLIVCTIFTVYHSVKHLGFTVVSY